MIGPQKPGRNRGYDPSNNNAPLQFDSSKGKPPMPLEGNQGNNPMQPQGGMNMMGGNQGPMGGPPGGMNMMGNNPGGMNMMGNNQGGMNMTGGNQGPPGGMNMMGFGGQMGFGGGQMQGQMQGQMMGDANMQMMYNQYSGWGPMGQNGPGMDGGQNIGPGAMMAAGSSSIPGLDLAMLAQYLPKEILRCKSSVCYPPPMNAPPPSVRERPPGCRTIFVGGIPENSTEDMLGEIFENFGIICSIRKGKKNFAHIRFEHEESADRALFMSGYRMKIEDKDDKENTGRLHVDYANARDDQYEFECKQRALAREMRHVQRMEELRHRPPSPPPIVHYNDHEAMTLLDKLKTEDSFVMGVHVLTAWLERGDCNKRNVSHFYTLIQCVNSRIRHLQNEKQAGEEEIERAKMKYRQLQETILQQFELIEKVFAGTQKQKNWDHFTKAQRKNLELWYKQIKETRQSQMDEYFGDRKEDDMEMSDSEEEPSKKKKKAATTVDEMVANANQEHINYLKSENDSLKCQLDAYKNEVEMIKAEQKPVDTSAKDSQIKMFQQALQGMQQQLIQAKQESKMIEKENEKLKQAVQVAKKELESKRERKKSETGKEEESKDETKEKTDEEKEETEKEKDDTEENKTETTAISEASILSDVSVSSSGLSISEKEVKLIGLISCFLHVHPMGASLEYIWSYVNQMGLTTKTSHLEDLLERLPCLFRLQTSGVGALIERKWQFTGYKDMNMLGMF